MLRWIDEQPSTPFLLTYMPIAGHHPYATPHGGPFKADGERGAYLNALRYADQALASLIDGLESRGLASRLGSPHRAASVKVRSKLREEWR